MLNGMPRDWILLIDPFKNLLTTYRMILEEEEYPVETASNLDEAYLLLKARQYSVIITEYIPPFQATDNMIKFVKKNTPETYIVTLTNAIIDEETYEKLFEMGVDDFILKPYSPEKILVHIRKGLKQRDMVLRNRELEREGLLDPIAQETQELIFSPRYFKKCLQQELKRAKRHHQRLSLLLIQIPDKEKFGDRFESFCIKLAKILRRVTREEDMVGRENGNFGILLPQTDQMGSQALVQRLSNLIRTYPPFKSDEVLGHISQILSFLSFTYPEKFVLPEPLKHVIEEVNKAH
jgi:PleD family two-component response regulator